VKQTLISCVMHFYPLQQLDVVKSTVTAANAELDILNKQLASAEQNRFNKETSTGQTLNRFPGLGNEVEQEIKDHQWLKDT
jgi:hypothetical protein